MFLESSVPSTTTNATAPADTDSASFSVSSNEPDAEEMIASLKAYARDDSAGGLLEVGCLDAGHQDCNEHVDYQRHPDHIRVIDSLDALRTRAPQSTFTTAMSSMRCPNSGGMG